MEENETKGDRERWRLRQMGKSYKSKKNEIVILKKSAGNIKVTDQNV